MARKYGTFTASRRAALRKAQLASAAKRRGKGKRKVSNRTKRVAKTVGIVGLAAAGGYGAYRATGSKVIVSKRTPTVYKQTVKVSGSPIKFDNSGFRVGTGRKFTTQGSPIGKPGLRVRSGARGPSLTYLSRNKRGDRNIIVATGVRTGIFGSKISGHPRRVTQFKPERAFVRRGAFKKSNYAHTNRAKRNQGLLITGKKLRHPGIYTHNKKDPSLNPIHIGSGKRKTGINEAEALRRTKSYVDARAVHGKKVSYSERNKALNRYRKQPR